MPPCVLCTATDNMNQNKLNQNPMKLKPCGMKTDIKASEKGEVTEIKNKRN